MKLLANKWDVLVFALIVTGFVYVASQRLGTVPLPETDESYTLQVPYEMLNRGKLALPILRYLGGNIENVWHSYTPVFFVLLSGFFKLFGWGIEQGRVFNLITAVLTLLMTWLIGRRLFNRPAALVAVTLLISDPVFMHRSRMLRNDFAAAAFALLAFYLFQIAESRKQKWLYLASGLAAGAGVMCHTNVLYLLIVVGVLLLIRHGWKALWIKETWLFAAGSLAVMAYEIIYILIDYQNFLLQNRDDRLHFHVLSLDGLRRNLVKEGLRYSDWLAATPVFPVLSRALLYVFFALTALGILYLVVRLVHAIRRGESRNDPRVHLLVATAVVVLFMAVVSGNKDLYYIAHLAPWFALCAGVSIGDALTLLPGLGRARWAGARPAFAAAIVAIVLIAAAYGRALARYEIRYLREVRNQDLALFSEFKSVLRSVVPDGLCPVAMKAPVMWLAFPESDRCFASIEERMRDAIDIDGNDYAVIMSNPQGQARSSWKKELDARYPLMAELMNTPYGDMFVYYSGTDPQYKQRTVRKYTFFGTRRGHYTIEQLEQAREVWSLSGSNLEAPAPIYELVIRPPAEATGISLIDLGTIDVSENAIHQAKIEVRDPPGKWQVVIVDSVSGSWIAQKDLDERPGLQTIEAMFRSIGTSQVRLSLRPVEGAAAGPIVIERAIVREVAPLSNDE